MVSIGNYSFVNCFGITTIVFPDSLKHIGKKAFDGCCYLENIYVGQGLISIGDDVFTFTAKRNVYIKDIKAWCNITIGTFSYYTGHIFKLSGRLYFNGEEIIDFEIPEGVENISDKAFWGCMSIKNLIFSNDVKSIGKEAFYRCNNLENVILSDNITNIGKDAFSECNKLVYNEYGNCKYLGTESNPYYALISTTTTNLSSYTIHRDTVIIADAAFDGCTRLEDVCFEGSQDIWQKIRIGSGNNCLDSITIHYDYVIKED